MARRAAQQPTAAPSWRGPELRVRFPRLTEQQADALIATLAKRWAAELLEQQKKENR